MSKYQEMCDAVMESERLKGEYREHCWQYMGTIYKGFLAYTQIPDGRVTLLKWNGSDDEKSRFSPSDGGAYAMAGATILGEDGFWRLGIRILLMPISTVWFAFFVAEQDGRPVVKVGDRTYKVDFEKPGSCDEIYEDIVKRVKDAFASSKRSSNRTIGFIVESTA
jgi:hypothetical protein